MPGTLRFPTPRWTTIQAKELGIAPPDNVPATIQERAWSSPIWYTPTKEQRTAAKKARPSPTCKAQGATAAGRQGAYRSDRRQDDLGAQHVTGDIFNIAWTTSGQRLIGNVNGEIPKPSEVGDVFHGGSSGTGTAYAIKDGAIVTTLGNMPYEATVYKLGDKYIAARSNEFGYANYEVVPTPQTLDPLDQPKSPF